MRILLTNDDGIYAPGIMALYHSLKSLGEVFLIAPERPRSASGHAITLHKPLRLSPTNPAPGVDGWACSGTPTDCVTLGWDVVMNGNVDLVVSGINDGTNLGWDVTYSGTVAAAFEGVILGAPSIAMSVASETEPAIFGPSATFCNQLAREIIANGLPPFTLLNVNAPNLPQGQLKGVRVTRQGSRQYVDRIDRRSDPRGGAYYWLSGSLKDDTQHADSDVHAVLEGYISVTPIGLDQTAYPVIHQINTIQNWNLKIPVGESHL